MRLALIDAARTGRAGSFIRGQLNQRLDEIMAKVPGDMFNKIGIGKGPKGVSIPNLLGGAVKTVDVVSDKARVNAGTVIVNGRNQGGTPASVPGGWSGSGPMIFNGFLGGLGVVIMQGFPGAGLPPMGGGGGLGGLNIGGIPLRNIATGGAGPYGLITGIQTGGARGGLHAGAGAAALAGSVLPLLTPMLAAAGPIGVGSAAALSMISALFGDPRPNRSEHIAHVLQATQFMAPPRLNVMESTAGTFADFDRFGNIRTSNLSPFPQVQGVFFAPGSDGQLDSGFLVGF